MRGSAEDWQTLLRIGAIAVAVGLAARLGVALLFKVVGPGRLGILTRGRTSRPKLGEPARASRPDAARLARLLADARQRPHARDLVQERLRALARDTAALRFELEGEAARELVESGSFPPGEGLADFLLEDWLAAKPGASDDFGNRAVRIVEELEKWASFTEKEKSDGKPD